MDTRARGDIAEAAVLGTLVAAGLLVTVPFSRFGPYDLVAELPAGGFVRIQVKSGRLRNGCVEFNCCSTDHGRGVGNYHGRADLFIVHVHETGQQYAVPVSESRGSKMYLRLRATANNQSTGVRWAADYHIDDWIDRVLATPQLGSPAPAGSVT